MNLHRLGVLTFTDDSTTSVIEKIIHHVEQGPTALMTLITPNIFHLNLATKDKVLAQTFNNADIRVPDGWPVAAALRAFSGYRGGRIAGSDLSLDVIDLAERRSYTVGLLGGSDDVLRDAYAKLGQQYPRLKLVEMVGNPVLPAKPTPESKRLLLESMSDVPVDILLFCLGAPKSETHVEACRDDMDAKVVLCVGATVDFLAGSAKRAPVWVQTVGLEWAFRLAQEPSRLWQRYLTSGLQFLKVIGAESSAVVWRIGKELKMKANR